jgi:hypothetical protein
MNRVFAADLSLFCISVWFVAMLALTAFASLLNLAVVRSDWAVSGYEAGRRYSTRQLLRMHRSMFKTSWTRRLFYVSSGIALAALIPYAVLSANDLMHNNLLHLISRGR